MMSPGYSVILWGWCDFYESRHCHNRLRRVFQKVLSRDPAQASYPNFMPSNPGVEI